MSFSLSVGGVNYAHWVKLDSIDISHGAESQGASCNFTLELNTLNVLSGVTPAPVGNMEVIIILDENTLAPTLFKGVLLSVTTTPPRNTTYTDYACSATTYNHWFDRKLIAVERPVESAGSRIRYLVGWIKSYMSDYDFTTNNVDDGFTVEEAEYDYVEFSSIMSELAEACQYQWYIDFEKDIHFYAQRNEPTHITNNILDIDADLTIGDVNVQEDISQIKNRVYIKGYSQKGDNKYKDGPYTPGDNQSFYKLYQAPFDEFSTEVYEVDDENNKIPGTDRTVTLDPLDGAPETITGAPGEAYVCLFNMGVRFPLSDLPLPDQKIMVEYNPELPDQVSMFEDALSIRYFRRIEGTSGIYEFMTSAPSLKVSSIDPIQAMGEYLLRRYAWPMITVNIATYEVHGWEPGQFFYLRSSNRNLYDYKEFESSGNKVDITMYVQTVTKKIYYTNEGWLLLETISATNMPYL